MASRLHEWDEQREYLDRMLHHVKFKYDHIDIRREYREHMEDMLDYYVESGMDEDSAKHTVLAEMGDADSLGRVLNEIHNPVVGWIWRVSRWVMTVAVIAGILAALFYFPVFASTAWRFVTAYDSVKTEAVLLCEADIGERVRIDDVHLFFDKLEVYEDGTAALYYVEWRNPLDRTVDWSFMWPEKNLIYDESGSTYYAVNDSSGGAFVDFRILTVKNFSVNAETFILDYQKNSRSVYLEVELQEEKP